MRRRVRPTVRLRLAALYAVAFLVSGALLLSVSYVVVRHSLLNGGAVAQHDRDDMLVDAVRRQLQEQTLSRLVRIYLLVLALTTLLSALLGWLMAGRALRPLTRIVAAAQSVSQENLDERIALQGPEDELKELADTFDTMLARLDAAFASQRSFVANASHELRTPLAIIRTEADVALQAPEPSVERLVSMARVVRTATERSERLIDGLLTLARSDSGDVARSPVDLAEVATSTLNELAGQAGARSLRVNADLREAWTTGDHALLERLVANLVENAVRYNVDGGRLDVTTDVRDGRAVLSVHNDGHPISQEEADTLTTPFRRLGAARTAAPDGSGLGLAIVAAVARAHGGTIDVDAPGTGLAVTVELPARAAPRRREAGVRPGVAARR